MSLIANDETPERVDPGEGPLDHPPVFAQMFAAFDAAPGNSRRDAPGAEVTAAATEVIAFVGVKFGRPFAGSAAWRGGGFERADIAGNARRGKTAALISPIALEAVKRIDALFEIERGLNGLSATDRLEGRRQQSAPLVADLEALAS